MKSIIFRGHDFAPICTAETVLAPSPVTAAKTRVIPGRPGALLLGGSLEPAEIRVKLMLRITKRSTAEELSVLRHMLAGWLGGVEGGELVLPEEPDLFYLDCLVTEAVAWNALFEDGECEVVFTAYDPVAWGKRRNITSARFRVEGTWRTEPVITVRASASSTFMVRLDDGAALTLAEPTKNGDVVVFDCARKTCTINGVAADAKVSLASDFFWLEPGEHTLGLRACSLVSCDFYERWL